MSHVSKPPLMGVATAACVGLALLGCGVLMLVVGAARPALDVWQARSWVQVPITDVEEEVFYFHGVTHRDSSFRYVVDGHAYEGQRMAFLHPSSYLNETELDAMRADFPAAAYIDPAQPRDVVVVRELPLSAYRVGGLVPILLGAFILLWSVRARQQGYARERLSNLWLKTMATLLVGLAALLAYRLVTSPTVFRVVLITPFALFFLAWAYRVFRGLESGLKTTMVAAPVIGLFVVLATINPFAVMDMPQDSLHEPGFLLEHAATFLSVLLGCVASALIAGTRWFGGQAREGAGGLRISSEVPRVG